MTEIEYQFLVTPEFDHARLDAFLSQSPDMPTRSACAKLIEDGMVEINGTPAHTKAEHVCLGDRIHVRQIVHVSSSQILPNPAIPLDIRYEDGHLLVISKQKNLVCHPSPRHENDTLANALVAHCGFDHLGKLQGNDRPGIVHRLDMDTTGLMVCAKDDYTQHALQDLIRLRIFDRRYLVLVHGYVAVDSGTITTGIARSKKDRLKMTISYDPSAREAITTFQTLERFWAKGQDDGFSLLECHLYTGRTHQIRVHMRHISHPVVGDPLYGSCAPAKNHGLSRQFLHSWYMSFDHPITHEHIELVDAPSPELMDVLREIAPQSMGKTERGQEIWDRLREQGFRL